MDNARYYEEVNLCHCPTYFGSTLNIKNWFASGDKLLWVAGNSDFANTFETAKKNTLLSDIGSALRLTDEQIEDAVSNDGEAYRLIAPNNGVSSILTDKVLEKAKKTLSKLGYPIMGEKNNFITKTKSYLSCAVGKCINKPFYDFYHFYFLIRA